MKNKTREEIITSLKMAETEEGRSGLLADFLAKNPGIKKEVKKDK